MTERLLLQGRYFSKLRKLGVVGLSASVVSGVAAYYAFYARRNRVYQDYEKNALVPAMQQKVDERLMKLSGFKRNENYPDLVFPPERDMTSPEALAQSSLMAPDYFLASLEFTVLDQAFGREATEVFAKCYIDDMRKSGYFKNDKDRKQAQQAFVTYKTEFLNAFRKTYPADVVKFADWMAKGMANRKTGMFFLYHRKPEKVDKAFSREFPGVFKKGVKIPSEDVMLYYVLASPNPASGPLHNKIRGDPEEAFEGLKKLWEVGKDNLDDIVERCKADPQKAFAIATEERKRVVKEAGL